MTKFVNYYNLCSLADPKEFLGISEGRESNTTLIATLSRNLVIVIKVTTQKQLHSWSVAEKLTSRVVYDRQSQRYVGAFGRFLRFWDESTKDINKCKKLKFHSNLAELVTFDSQTYVLFKNGECELLEKAVENRKDESKQVHDLHIDTARTFLNVRIFKTPDDRLVLTYFERNNSNGELELVCQYIGDSNAKRFKIVRESLDVSVTGYAVIESKTYPMLLTIWSDKRLFVLMLNDSALPSNSPGTYVSMITALRVDSPLSILGISENFVAIYGANSGQEGASLLLYNTQFKVVKAKQFFKVYCDYSKLWNIGEHIIVAMGPNLIVVSYHMSRELLADLVGTQLSNDFQTTIEVDHINEEEQLQEYMQFNKNQTVNITSRDASDSNEYFADMRKADGKTVAYVDAIDFDETLYQLSKIQLGIDLVETEEPTIDEVKVVAMGTCESAWISTPEIQLIVQQLENCGASEHEIGEKVFPLLIKADLLSDIVACLQRYTNIPERVLVQIMHYLLQRIRTKSQATVDNTNTNAASSSSTNPNDLEEETAALQVLLGCDMDVQQLSIYFRNSIDYTNVRLFLDVLYKQLTAEESSSTLSRPYYSDMPPFMALELCILRWFQACLNAHYQKLAISKDMALIDVLYKWHQHIEQYKTEITELNQTLAVLYNMVERRKIFKEQNYSKWYSIEEVTLF